MYLSVLSMETSKAIFHKLKHQIDAGLSESERDAISFLILDHFGYSKKDVLLDVPLAFAEAECEQIISRINNHEPVQYVLGQAWFFGRPFKVRPGVLIPRPETELLVELALRTFSKDQPIRVLDLGSGSGCIPVTLAAECPLWKVSAIDLNPIALQVTQENAELNGVVIDVRKADMLSGLSDSGERYEIILSNPPYIPYSDRGFMQPHVVDFEPHDALFVPDDDPLLFYKAIVQIAVGHLEKNGLVAVEIQEKFGVPVQQLFEKAGLKSVDILRDLDGKDRIVGGKK